MKLKVDNLAQTCDTKMLQISNFLTSELKLLALCLMSTEGEILSIGCDTGLFEVLLQNHYNIKVASAIEYDANAASVAEKRGLKIFDKNQVDELEENTFDHIYINRLSALKCNYMDLLKIGYKALKKNGIITILDVPKESALGIMFKLAQDMGGWDNPYFNDIEPRHPYTFEKLKHINFTTTVEKVEILKNIGFKEFSFAQTLTTHPIFFDDKQEEPIEGYSQGNFVAINAVK